MLVSIQPGSAVAGALVSAPIVKRWGATSISGGAVALAAAGILLTVFPSLAAVAAGYALAGFAGPIGWVNFYNAAQRRVPPDLFARTMVAFASAMRFPQAISIPATAALLAIAGFRPLILSCGAIALLGSAYVWRGGALMQPATGRHRRHAQAPSRRPVRHRPRPLMAAVS